MITDNTELFNVVELIDGAADEILDDEAIAFLRERSMDAGDLASHETFMEEKTGAGNWLTRIPDSLRRQCNCWVRLNAFCTSGVESRFNLEGDSAKVVLRSTGAPSMVEVFQGDFFVRWDWIGNEPTEICVNRPVDADIMQRLAGENGCVFDPRLTRVRLPWWPLLRLIGVEGEVGPPRSDQVPGLTCLSYGSSITHGATSIRPTGTYASRTAQMLGVDHINLGFGGGAHLEPEMAVHIAGRTDWDFATIELGINLISSIDVEEFARRVDTFISTVTDARPQAPIFCIDIFPCRDDFIGGGAAAAFREVVEEKVRRVNRPNVIHLPGKLLLQGADGLTADLVHPSPAGMEEIARNLSEAIKRSGLVEV
jgi:lysophospholipase L1-like esterase